MKESYFTDILNLVIMIHNIVENYSRPKFLADSVEATLTPVILMSLIGGCGQCLARITKNSVLSQY